MHTRGSSPRAWQDRRTCTRPTAATRSRRSTSSPPTTGSRCADLVSYNEKHNEANLEDNRDGTDDNRSWNHGVEGPTDDPAILELRARQQRNFLTTLILSQGTPMLLGGDERGRSQFGNNNAWCQDNELSWYLWEDTAESAELHAFTRRLIALRREHPVFRRETFLRGKQLKSPLADVWWFRTDGRKMTRADWNGEHVLGMFLNGREIVTPGPFGEEIVDDSFMVLFNAHGEDRMFKLPRRRFGLNWVLELSTADPGADSGQRALPGPDRGRGDVALDRRAQAGVTWRPRRSYGRPTASS